MHTWSATTGANLLTKFEDDQAEGKETRYRVQGKGYDYRGEQKFNEYTIRGLVPAKSNDLFTVIRATAIGVPFIELRVYHGSHYGVTAD